MEETSALEASKSRLVDTEASAVEMQTRLTEMRRTVDERDEQLQTLQDELTTVCYLLIIIIITSAEERGYVFGSVCLSVCLFVCLSVGLLANL